MQQNLSAQLFKHPKPLSAKTRQGTNLQVQAEDLLKSPVKTRKSSSKKQLTPMTSSYIARQTVILPRDERSFNYGKHVSDIEIRH
jgi:hypothetical protein